MAHRYAWEPVRDAAGDRAALLAACGPRRLCRVKRLQKTQQEVSLNAQRLCRRLWAELADRPEEDFRIEADENGRPFSPEAPCCLSLSHSGSCVAAAASFEPVGIDLQAIRPISDRLLARYCSEEERAWAAEAQSAERIERAVRLWTMKEAYGKMLGIGIFTAHRFNASFEGGRLATGYADARFLFPASPEGYLFTVCLPPEG